MNVVGGFIEGLSRTECDRLVAPYTHNDRAFQNVDESVGIMSANQHVLADRSPS